MIPLYNEGDQVDAVVPFMGESITDGTLAAFLKSMYIALSLSPVIFFVITNSLDLTERR